MSHPNIYELPPEEITAELIASLSDEELELLMEIISDKEVYYDNVQYTKKIEINSLYGMLGASESVFYDIYLSSSVTSYGRLSIQCISALIDNQIKAEAGEFYKKKNVTANKPNGSAVVYSHTDSVYFELSGYRKLILQREPDLDNDEVIKKLISKGNVYCDRINKEIFPNITDFFNCRENLMNMNFEVFADKGIFLKKARYFLRKIMEDANMLPIPKYKITGMEIKKAHTPKITKKLLAKDKLDIFLDKGPDEIIKFIKDCEKKFMNAPINDILRPINVSKVLEFEVSDEAMKECKERIFKFSAERRKHMEPVYNKKYADKVSDLVKKIGNTEEEFQKFLDDVEDWSNRVNNEDGTMGFGVVKALGTLSFIDSIYTGPDKSKTGEDRSLGEIQFMNALYNAIKGEGKESKRYIPNKTFMVDTGDFLMKNLSFNSKLAILHNKFLEFNRDKYPTVESIFDGDKMKWGCIKTPNPFFNSARIGIKSEELLPLLEKYIDKKKQFAAGFETPVKEITDAVGVEFYWNPNKRFF